MAISRLSSQDANAFSATSSATATYPGATTAGDLLIAVVNSNNSTANTSITGAGTWTELIGHAGGGTSALTLFYKLAAGTETTVTGTITSGSFVAIDIFEYTGNANPIQTDGTAAGNSGAPGTSQATPSITTSNANDLIFVAAGFVATVSSPSWTTSSLIGSNVANAEGLFCGQDIVSSTQSSFSDTAHWTGTAAAATIICAFQAAASGTTTSTSASTSTSISSTSTSISTSTSLSSTSSSISTTQSTSTSLSSTSTSTTQSFTTSTSISSTSSSISTTQSTSTSHSSTSTSMSTSTSISSTSSSTSTSTSISSTSHSTSTSFSTSSTSTSQSTSISTTTSQSTSTSFSTTFTTSTSVSSTSSSTSSTTTLIDQTKPIGKINPQNLSNLPITSSNTLVNDPVALVDDPNALVGGPTTQISVLGTSTSSNAPTGFIKIRS